MPISQNFELTLDFNTSVPQGICSPLEGICVGIECISLIYMLHIICNLHFSTLAWKPAAKFEIMDMINSL